MLPARPALDRRTCDDIDSTRARSRAARRAACRRTDGPDGFARVAADQRLPPAPGRLRGRDDRPAARRPHRRPDAPAGRHRPRRYVGDTVRTTVEQNIVLRWVSEADLPALYEELRRHRPRRRRAPERSSTSRPARAPTPASSGIASSRGPGRRAAHPPCRGAVRAGRGGARPAHQGQRLLQLVRPAPRRRHRLLRQQPQDRRRHRARTSRSCSGASGARTPARTGWRSARCPRKRIPEVVEAITARFVAERATARAFQDWIARLGKKELGCADQRLQDRPLARRGPELLHGLGRRPRVHHRKDMGIGECAGEVVSSLDLELSKAESMAFEAQIALDEGDLARADELRLRRRCSRRPTRSCAPRRTSPAGRPDTIVREFRERFYDTELFFDRFAKGKFARPLFARHESGAGVPSRRGRARRCSRTRRCSSTRPTSATSASAAHSRRRSDDGSAPRSPRRLGQVLGRRTRESVTRRSRPSTSRSSTAGSSEAMVDGPADRRGRLRPRARRPGRDADRPRGRSGHWISPRVRAFASRASGPGVPSLISSCAP